jgi:hypothetical protein
MTITLLSRFQQFNKHLSYLPGTGYKFDTSKTFYDAIPTYAHTISAISNYKWYDENKSGAEVCAYFGCLLVINDMTWGITGT